MKYFIFFKSKNYSTWTFKAFLSKASAERWIVQSLDSDDDVFVIEGKKLKLSRVIKAGLE